jgi:hypothetical protein
VSTPYCIPHPNIVSEYNTAKQTGHSRGNRLNRVSTIVSNTPALVGRFPICKYYSYHNTMTSTALVGSFTSDSTRPELSIPPREHGNEISIRTKSIAASDEWPCWTCVCKDPRHSERAEFGNGSIPGVTAVKQSCLSFFYSDWLSEPYPK